MELAVMSDIDRYKPLLKALTRQDPNRSLRLPREPKRALGDVKAIQRDILAERELRK